MAIIRLALLAVLAVFEFAGTGPEPPALVPGQRQVVSPTASSLRFTVRLEAGQFALAVVDQGTIDLAVSITDPEGRRLRTVDGFEFGSEFAPIEGPRSGPYTVEVSSTDRKVIAGKIAVTLEILRAAKAGDSRWGEASILATQAKRLASDGAPQQLKEALEASRQALAIWTELKEQRAAARTLLKIGDLMYALSDGAGARPVYEQALKTCRGLSDTLCSSEALNNLGMCEWGMGEIELAFSHLSAALDGWKSAGFSYGEAAAENNLGLLAWQTGEWQTALNHYLRVRDLFRSVDRTSEALTLNNIGLIYLSLGESEKAIQHFDLAVKNLFEQGDRLAAGRTLINVGRACLLDSRPEQALANFDKALPLIEPSTDRKALADLLNNSAQALVSLGRLDEARERLARAQQLYEDLADLRGKASVLHHTGLLLYRRHDSDGAKAALAKAIDLRHALRMPDDEAESRYWSAIVDRDLGNLERAKVAAGAALDLIEPLRERAAGERFRSSYFSSKYDYYKLAIDLSMRLHDASPLRGYDREAFNLAERARARSLIDATAETREDIRRGVDGALVEKEGTLRRRLNYQSQQLLRLTPDEGNKEKVRRLESETDASLTALHEVQAAIRAHSPSYAAVVDPRPLTFEQIQARLLDPGTLLLEYSLGEPRSYLWAISRDRLQTFELPAGPEIEETASHFLTLLALPHERSTSPKLQSEMRTQAARLGQILLGPVVDHIKGRKLAVVSEGILQHLPLAALPVRISGGDPVALGAVAELVTLPSASSAILFQDAVSGRPAPKATIAVVADPVFEAGDPRVHRSPAKSGINGSTRSAVDDGGPKLARLSFSRMEAAYIRKSAPEGQVKTALGFEATRELLESGRLADCRIIHLATHAIVDDRRPERSVLALSLVDEQGRPQSGLIGLTDLYNLPPLRAELVVLSACRTAIGKEIRGEGLMSLSRGFMYAGVPNLLVSLWKVDDEATAELMRLFYRALFRAERPRYAAALRDAQREMAARGPWRDPFYWSGFILQSGHLE